MPDEDRREIDVFMKKILGTIAAVVITGIASGTVTFVKMGSAVEALTTKTDKHEQIITTDNKTIIEIQIEQKYIKEDINEMKSDLKEILRAVKK